MPRVTLYGIEVVEREHSVRADLLSIETPDLRLRRGDDGTLDLSELVANAEPLEAQATEAEPETDDTEDPA